ncbi:MAG: LysR family transcriptional regulator [Kordiimonas sp.]
MDLRAIDFDWNQARTFLVTAEEGSFSAAAKKLDLTQPTLGRQVRALEETLGVILFERLGRGLTLTPCGQELVEYVNAMAEAASHVSLAATGQSQDIEGTVGISVSESVGAYLMHHFVSRLKKVAPGITLNIVAVDTPSDLLQREADIAIRNFRPTEPDLIAKKIKDSPACLYATTDFLKQYDNPKTIEDFSKLPFIGFDQTDAFLNGLKERGLTVTRKNFSVLAKNHIVHWEMAKRGLGIGIIEENIGKLEPNMEKVLGDTDPFMFPIWLASHRELKTNKRIRIVFDLLADEVSHW